MKLCCACEQPLPEGRKLRRCTTCNREYLAEWRAKNPEKALAISRRWHKNNAEKHRERTRQWARDNAEQMSEYRKKWAEENRGKLNARDAKRRAAKLQRTPAWNDELVMRMIYEDCPVGHEVDHIIPLQGKNVSGLHVHYNLQYLTAEENRSKGNRYG